MGNRMTPSLKRLGISDPAALVARFIGKGVEKPVITGNAVLDKRRAQIAASMRRLRERKAAA